MILVTGATGTNGREILVRLDRLGVSTTAMVRRPDDAKGIPSGIGRVAGDFNDERSLDRALAGVECAFLLTPSTEHAEAQQKRFVAAAARAGVRRVVKVSQFAADADSPVRFLRYHAAVEAAIRRTDMTWTFLRPNLFMQGLLHFGGMIQRQNMFAAPIGSARVSAVDVRDIADVAVAALTEPGHEGRTYTLTGPEALTHKDMAVRLSAPPTARPAFSTSTSNRSAASPNAAAAARTLASSPTSSSIAGASMPCARSSAAARSPRPGSRQPRRTEWPSPPSWRAIS